MFPDLCHNCGSSPDAWVDSFSADGGASPCFLAGAEVVCLECYHVVFSTDYEGESADTPAVKVMLLDVQHSFITPDNVLFKPAPPSDHDPESVKRLARLLCAGRLHPVPLSRSRFLDD
jgi:hypothetical protein